jgi:hypothetical protein
VAAGVYQEVSYVAEGGSVAGGSSTVRFGAVRTAAGGIVAGGSASTIYGGAWTGSCGALVGGAGTVGRTRLIYGQEGAIAGGQGRVRETWIARLKLVPLPLDFAFLCESSGQTASEIPFRLEAEQEAITEEICSDLTVDLRQEVASSPIIFVLE